MKRTSHLNAGICVATFLLPHIAVAGTCLDANIMPPSGMAVTSPYGVDRTGRASKGWHMGLDIVNAEGKGSPIFTGSSGSVDYRYQASGGGHYITVNSGDMRFIYMHLQNADQALRGKSVSAGQQIGQMGCSGMKDCAPHLHLSAQIRGDALAASGGVGRTFTSMSKDLSNQPLTADAIKNAMPNNWYVVNPETYLPQQIPIQEGLRGYASQMGGWRSQTLARTCAPDSTILPNARIASTTDSGSQGSALDTQSSMRSGGEGYFAAAADQELHGLTIELAKLAAAEATQSTSSSELMQKAQNDSALAHLLIIESDKR